MAIAELLFDKGHTLDEIGNMTYEVATALSLAHWERKGLELQLLSRALFGSGENTVGDSQTTLKTSGTIPTNVESDIGGQEYSVSPVRDNPFPAGMSVETE